MPELLEVDNLQTQLHLPQGSAHVVDHVSFTLAAARHWRWSANQAAAKQ